MFINTIFRELQIQLQFLQNTSHFYTNISDVLFGTTVGVQLPEYGANKHRNA
jgi:hypothetical protein